MGENRSLDEFVPASDDADDGADGNDDAADADEVSADDTVEAPTDPTGGDEEAATDDEEEHGAVDEGVEDQNGESEGGADADGSDEEADLPGATYRWSPDGDDCPVCGNVVDRQWRDGDRFVCADCKEW